MVGLSPLLFNFALEHAIRRARVNQDGLKLNGTYQLLIYADYVNILTGSVHTTKENETLVLASKEIGLEVNADKTKYMFMSRDQNIELSHCIKMIIMPLKGRKSQIFGNNLNKSKFYSGRN
jgi:hypothetical protein